MVNPAALKHEQTALEKYAKHQRKKIDCDPHRKRCDHRQERTSVGPFIIRDIEEMNVKYK